MDIFIDKKEYHSDIFSNLESIQNFILNHINLKGEIKGLYRTDTYEIPVVALREALINALIHRDYVNSGRDIKVGIYDDIVNIVSPGAFPNTITKEDIENGRSEARNKVLANVFKELGLIEQWGSGIKRIKSLCLENDQKEPSIQEKNDFVDVEFYRPQEIKMVDYGQFATDTTVKQPETNDYERIPPETAGIPPQATNYDQLRPITTDYDRLILEFINKNGKITRKEALQILSVKETKIKEVFNQMIEDKKIVRRGSGRSTYYEVVR